jgi:hypothetical protein
MGSEDESGGKSWWLKGKLQKVGCSAKQVFLVYMGKSHEEQLAVIQQAGKFTSSLW